MGKDPNAPKRPASAYFLYVAEVRQDVVEELGKSDIAAVGKKMGEMWRDLSEEEKSKYIETANELKAEYQENLLSTSSQQNTLLSKRKKPQPSLPQRRKR